MPSLSIRTSEQTLIRWFFVSVVVLVQTAYGQRGLTPEAALKKLHVAKGLKLELFASEPMVRQPVTMTVDRRGRVWVIQYLQYPRPAGLKKVAGDQYDRIRYDRLPKPPPHGPRGADRVTILEDVDGDGRADRATDFVAGLNLASGLAIGHGGVWVLQSPYLLFYADKNGDDRPDGPPRVHLVGFGMDDAHSVANSLQWGPDGWLYGAHGSTVNANVRGVRFQQGIWRYHPQTDRFELFSEGGGNTYGLDFDRYGNAIAGTNWGIPGLHQMQGAYHVKVFGKHGALHNPYAFGYFPHMPHQGKAIGKLSVGGIFYQASQWPTRFHGKYITANPLNHALYSIDLHPRGSTFTTSFHERLMWSDDPWFQPVDIALETDGSMLVADWYDGNITYQITYRKKAGFDRNRGRIYRIRSVDFRKAAKTPSNVAEILQATDTELFHNNVTRVRSALQALNEKPDPSRVSHYAKILAQATNDDRRALHALWALNLCRKLSSNDDLAAKCLQHRLAVIRAWTVRLLGDDTKISARVVQALVTMAATEQDIRVRSQLACTAKRLDGVTGLAIVRKLSGRSTDTKDPYLPLLLWWALESKTDSHRHLVMRWLKTPSVWQLPLVQETIVPRLARRYAAQAERRFMTKTPQQSGLIRLDNGFAACAQLLAHAPSSRDVERVLQGMEQQLQGLRRGKMPDALRGPLAQLWRQGDHPTGLILFSLRMGNVDAAREAVRRILQKDLELSQRLKLIDALGQAAQQTAIQPLIRLLQGNRVRSIRSAALRSLGRFDDQTVAAAILRNYPKFDRVLRSDARQVLYSRAGWTLQLLKKIDSGDLKSAEVPNEDLRSVFSHNNPKIKELAQKHFGRVRLTSPQEKRNRMLVLGRIVTSGSKNSKRGKRLFMSVCGKCHRLHGEGAAIGPDLTPYPRHELGYLLLHTVDPSAVVRPAYQSVVISTNDGRLLTGRIIKSTPRTVTVLDIKNKQTVLARSEIDAMKDSPQSLMPEKAFAKLKDQEIRDLFGYLQSKPSAPLRNDIRLLLIHQAGFDLPSAQWTVTDNGARTKPVHIREGGNPGGWLRLEDGDGGRMAIVLPASWTKSISTYNGGVLSFDARTVDSDGGTPHADFGLVEITSGGRVYRSDAAPGRSVPAKRWSKYQLPLTAKRFRVSKSQWSRILAGAQRIMIRLEGFASANEIMGLDNVSLHR